VETWRLVLVGVLVLLVVALVIVTRRKPKNTQDGNTPKKTFSDTYSEIFLSETNLKFSQAMLIKLGLFLLVLVMVYGIKLTNISFYTEKALTSLEMDMDLKYRQEVEVKDKVNALQQEIVAFNYLINTFPKEEYLTMGAENVMFMVSNYVHTNNIRLVEDENAFANKVYYRALTYYEARVWDHSTYFGLAFLASMLAEVMLLLYKNKMLAEDRANVEFLKSIFVISGTLNNSFAIALDAMYEKARPNIAKELDKIREALAQNTEPVDRVMKRISKEQKTVYIRMFFEKLEEAQNGDFNKAIMNIKKELKYDRSDIKRKTIKKVVNIHSLGQTLFFVLMAFLMFYFFIPWMKVMDMANVSF
jgi:hypothetical protein